jgi:hypothetical protein
VQRVYRQSTRVLSVLALLTGVALVAVTVAGGGGPLARGVLLGALLAALGAGRLVLARAGAPRR